MKLLFDIKDFEKTAKSLNRDAAKVTESASKGLAGSLKMLVGNASQNHLSGQDLNTRTGNLKRAVDGWMQDKLTGVVGVAPGSAVESYKWMLGGETKTIKPKTSRFLAIPIADGLTPSGVARFASPREVDDGFFFESNGQLLFGRRSGKTERSKMQLLFVFKKSVTVEGSDALAKGVTEKVDEVTQNITDAIEIEE